MSMTSIPIFIENVPSQIKGSGGEAQPVAVTVELAPLYSKTEKRYYLTITQGDRCWTFPLLLKQFEASWLLQQVKGWDWTLHPTEVWPLNIRDFYNRIERLIDRELPELMAQWGAAA